MCKHVTCAVHVIMMTLAQSQPVLSLKQHVMYVLFQPHLSSLSDKVSNQTKNKTMSVYRMSILDLNHHIWICVQHGRKYRKYDTTLWWTVDSSVWLEQPRVLNVC